MPRSRPALALKEGDEQQLRQWVAAFGTPQQVSLRSRIVLAAASGKSDSAIARELDVNRNTVILWRGRFQQEGLDGLWEVGPGRGRKPTYGPEKVEAIIDATLRTKPKGMTQWSCRLMADSQGVSKSTINNIWQSHNLKPHRVKTFKLSRDAKFLEKLTDVVGLYLNPPQQAMVLCVDEKSQIQALDRTQPGLPIKKGRCGTMTHDYKRNGTTTLFAALEVLQGRVIGECLARHRHQERHPRFVPHFVPTSSSWLNLVERWFGELTSKRIRRGSFGSVEDLEKAIEDFLAAWNEKPKPFVWTATVESIMEKLSRCRQTLEKIQPGCTQPRKRKAKK